MADHEIEARKGNIMMFKQKYYYIPMEGFKWMKFTILSISHIIWFFGLFWFAWKQLIASYILGQ